jgi:hypothetical protein
MLKNIRIAMSSPGINGRTNGIAKDYDCSMAYN